MAKPTTDEKKTTPAPNDVEPGSDADATPVPPIGKTPPDPNEKK